MRQLAEWLACLLIAAALLPDRVFAEDDAQVERLREIPDNTWLLVDRGGITAPLEIMAYSGGWFDSDHNQFCIFGGGHFNYSGNEVWCLDVASLTWREIYRPDAVVMPPYSGADQGAYANFREPQYPGALFNPADESIETAAPVSRHTYDQLEFIPGRGALLWGGYAWGDSGSPWCTLCRDTWLFDHATHRWQYLYDGDNPSPNTTAGVGASAYSLRDARLFAKILDETWTYDPASGRWSVLKTVGSPPWTIEGTLEYDPVHHKIYFFGGNYEPNLTLWVLDTRTRTWSEVRPVGQGPGGAASSGPGMAYDTRNDVLAIYSAGTIWIYDPASNEWRENRPEPRPSDDSYVFGRFRYDPVNNGFWLHAPDNGTHTTWFYRYRN